MGADALLLLLLWAAGLVVIGLTTEAFGRGCLSASAALRGSSCWAGLWACRPAKAGDAATDDPDVITVITAPQQPQGSPTYSTLDRARSHTYFPLEEAGVLSRTYFSEEDLPAATLPVEPAAEAPWERVATVDTNGVDGRGAPRHRRFSPPAVLTALSEGMDWHVGRGTR